MSATRCQILKLKCNKFNFRWDSAPDPTRGVYNAPRTHSCIIRWAYSKGWKGRGKDGNGEGGKKEKVREGKEGEKGKRGRHIQVYCALIVHISSSFDLNQLPANM